MSRFFSKKYSSDSESDDTSSFSDSDSSYDSSDSSELDYVAKKKVTADESTGINKWKKQPTATVAKAASAGAKKSASAAADYDSDDSYFDQDSSSDSSESDDEVQGLTGRNKWLKKHILEARGLLGALKEEDGGSKADTKKKQKQPRQQKIAAVATAEEDAEAEAAAQKKIAALSGTRTVQLTQESLYKQLEGVLEARGKKNTDKQLQVDTLRALYTTLAHTPYQKVRVLLALLPAQFDVAITTTFMAGDLWKDMASDIKDLLEIIEENRHIIIADTVDVVETDADNERKLGDGENVYLSGNIGSFIDRMDQEFIKSLQNIDPHSMEYVERLKTETELYTLILRVQHYFEETESRDALASIIMCRIEHTYYKPLSLINSLHEQVKQDFPSLTPLLSLEDPVDHLCRILYKAPHDRIRTRALLCHVYHHALHDRYDTARDLLLMSHIQEFIQNADIQTQTLYNRAMVQLGLAAFRCGLIKECADALNDLFSSGKIRDLLSQGGSSRPGQSSDQEKLEKARQMPFHMHINLEVLECVYLTCSMLLEVPSMALHKYDHKKKVISKPFKRLMDYHERQVFLGPAENVRDFIMEATKSMLEGDWAGALESILSIKTWSLMRSFEKVKEMLIKKIKQETLVTFVYSSLYNFQSLSVHFLAESFELPLKQVVKSLSLMISSGSIPAKFESGYVVLIAQERSKLQSLVLAYTEKINLMVDNNEKMMDVKLGVPDDRRKPKRERK